MAAADDKMSRNGSADECAVQHRTPTLTFG